jgi:hypothetical protein
MTIDRFITIHDAAARLRLPEVMLRALIEKGRIRAAILPDGAIGVSERVVIRMAPPQNPIPKEELPEYQKHAHLKGQAIWQSEAARKYNISSKTISRWVSAGIIKSLGMDGNKMLIDEADMAYCAEIYHQRSGQGKWLFNKDGTPYQKGKTGPLRKTKESE